MVSRWIIPEQRLLRKGPPAQAMKQRTHHFSQRTRTFQTLKMFLDLLRTEGSVWIWQERRGSLGRSETTRTCNREFGESEEGVVSACGGIQDSPICGTRGLIVRKIHKLYPVKFLQSE